MRRNFEVMNYIDFINRNEKTKINLKSFIPLKEHQIQIVSFFDRISEKW